MIRSHIFYTTFCLLWGYFCGQVARAAGTGDWQIAVLDLLLYATPILIILAHRYELYDKWIAEDVEKGKL